MSAVNKIKRNYLKCESNIKLLLNTPKNKFNADLIHKLRIEIKKVYSLIELLDYCIKKFERKKARKAFRELFYFAGEVRELDILLQSLKKNKSVKPINRFINEIKKTRIRLERKLAALDNREFNHERIKLHKIVINGINQIENSSLLLYFQKERKDLLNKCRTKKFNTNDLHRLRKSLKRYFYNLKYIGIKNSGAKEVLDLIGKWHDCQVNVFYLKKEKVGIKKSNESQNVQKIIDEQKQKMDKLAKDVRKNLLKVKLAIVGKPDL